MYVMYVCIDLLVWGLPTFAVEGVLTPASPKCFLTSADHRIFDISQSPSGFAFLEALFNTR